MVQDRVGGDEYTLTHELLGRMLGVRRASVSEAADEFRTMGLIGYRRGHVTILNRPLLQAQACECYGSIRDVFDRLYI
jgi:hypothetical protein